MSGYVGDGIRRCHKCHRQCPTRFERGKLYLLRHPGLNLANCPGSGQRAQAWLRRA